MDLQFSPVSMTSIFSLMGEYLQGLSSPFESYLEDHILKSQAYAIRVDDELCGYFAVFQGSLLTQFYLQKHALMHSQMIFQEVLKLDGIESAYAYTGDELFLSLCMDYHTRLEKQAFFFQDSGNRKELAPFNPRGDFRLARQEDIPLILHETGDFFDLLDWRVYQGQIYLLTERKTLLGAGIMEPGVLLKGTSSVGMITCESFRRQGLGRAIIHRLMDQCYGQGITPLAGCWYYNTASRLTLESAGMVTRSRMFKVFFR